MVKSKEGRGTELEALLTIQKEMLEESRRLSVLTGWLIGLTALLVSTSVLTIIGLR